MEEEKEENIAPRIASFGSFCLGIILTGFFFAILLATGIFRECHVLQGYPRSINPHTNYKVVYVGDSGSTALLIEEGDNFPLYYRSPANFPLKGKEGSNFICFWKEEEKTSAKCFWTPSSPSE